jgi:hypothetical protein
VQVVSSRCQVREKNGSGDGGIIPCRVALCPCSWDPQALQDWTKKGKIISLTWHLVRISKHPTAMEAPTPMLGCTNVFP